MKIKCEPGVVVKLDDQRTTSVKGGTYEVDEQSFDREQLKRKGVTEAGKSVPHQEVKHAD